MNILPWVGARRVAIVPVLDLQVDREPPPDWEYQVYSRVFYDPQPGTGLDQSFQHYLQALSYGKAIIEGEVFPLVRAPDAEVNIPAMNSLPAGHGYQYLLAVLPHEAGQHRGGHAFAHVPEVNGITGWARVAMFTNPLMQDRQSIGVWGQELLHLLCELFEHPNLPGYDVMDGDGARRSVHASATTKSLFGWLPKGIVDHTEGTLDVNLHAIGLAQPPPPDRVTAVRIPSRRTSNHFFVEARLRTDPFDGMIPFEGVLVYEVSDTVKVNLRTSPVLTQGQTFNNPDEGLRVTVNAALAGGFAVSISMNPDPTVSGRLLSYGDAGTPGNVSSPVVVGFGGWKDFKFLFGGGNLAGENRIYAVDQNGQLLSYGDAGTPGNVSSPVVVGFGGWKDFKFLFSGKNLAGENRIYAVDQNGQLLSYGDAGTPGNVSSPVVVGFGGWQDFKFLFGGGNLAGENRIYAVDQNGQLLSYGDAGTPGNVSSPVVVGFGGWKDFKFLFGGGNLAGENRIYAVDQNGQLLSYGDAGTPGNVSSPVVVGFGGWKDFKFLFSGKNLAGENRIYAVVA
ncbi:MAG: hypothetical protein AB1522_10555 [Chloroflexota bacterium]